MPVGKFVRPVEVVSNLVGTADQIAEEPAHLIKIADRMDKLSAQSVEVVSHPVGNFAHPVGSFIHPAKNTLTG